MARCVVLGSRGRGACRSRCGSGRDRSSRSRRQHRAARRPLRGRRRGASRARFTRGSRDRVRAFLRRRGDQLRRRRTPQRGPPRVPRRRDARRGRVVHELGPRARGRRAGSRPRARAGNALQRRRRDLHRRPGRGARHLLRRLRRRRRRPDDRAARPPARDHPAAARSRRRVAGRALHLRRVHRGPRHGGLDPGVLRGARHNSVVWPTSHSPFLSQPDLVVDLLAGLATA